MLFATLATAARAADAIETITVSAAPIALEESGSAVTLIDGTTLEQRQIGEVFDALRDVPGVEVSRTGTVGSLAQVRIRGAEAGQALVLIDGVRANDPAQSSEEFNFAHLLTPAIERIEVLRGPQSALWGADALAGVINVVTVHPEPGYYARGSGEYGSFDTKQLTALVNAGTTRYAAVADASWLDTAGTNIARTGNENDGYRNVTLGVRANAGLTPDLSLSLALRHVAARSDTDTTDFFGTFAIPTDSGDISRFYGTYGRAEARWSPSGAVEFIAGASLTRTEMKDYAGAFGAPFDVSFNDRTKGGDTRFDAQSNIRWNAWGADQRLSLLAETERETFSSLRLDFPAADQRQHQTHSGLAGEYWLSFDNVFVSLGARHDWNDRFADSTTWRATVGARLSDRWRLHASAGTGVKNPDFFELFGFVPSPVFVGNPDLKPERSFGYDAGIEWRWRALTLDLTYFNADLTDEIFTDFSVSPNTARNAPGKSRRQGIEAAARVALTDALTLDAAYTCLDAEEADDAAEIRRPHNIASLNLDYAFAGGRAFANLGIDYHGAQKDTAFLNAPPFSAPVTLGAYTLVRVAASYNLTDNVSLYARVENPLDEQYEEVFGYQTRGFGAFGGIKLRWD